MKGAKQSKPPPSKDADGFEKFKELARRLVSVPKSEVNRKARENEREKADETDRKE